MSDYEPSLYETLFAGSIGEIVDKCVKSAIELHNKESQMITFNNIKYHARSGGDMCNIVYESYNWSQYRDVRIDFKHVIISDAALIMPCGLEFKGTSAERHTRTWLSIRYMPNSSQVIKTILFCAQNSNGSELNVTNLEGLKGNTKYVSSMTSRIKSGIMEVIRSSKTESKYALCQDIERHYGMPYGTVEFKNDTNNNIVPIHRGDLHSCLKSPLSVDVHRYKEFIRDIDALKTKWAHDASDENMQDAACNI